MTRRQARVWAGVVMGSLLLVGCQTLAPESDVPQPVLSKAVVNDARDIGPLGGQLVAGDYRLSIPPGALLSTVHISIVQEAVGEWPVLLGPEGQQFLLPATLAFDAASEADPQSMAVAWWNPSTSQWVDQLTAHDGCRLSTQISHFSRWVIH